MRPLFFHGLHVPGCQAGQRTPQIETPEAIAALLRLAHHCRGEQHGLIGGRLNTDVIQGGAGAQLGLAEDVQAPGFCAVTRGAHEVLDQFEAGAVVQQDEQPEIAHQLGGTGREPPAQQQPGGLVAARFVRGDVHDQPLLRQRRVEGGECPGGALQFDGFEKRPQAVFEALQALSQRQQGHARGQILR